MPFYRWGRIVSVFFFLAGISLMQPVREIDAGCTCYDCDNMMNRYNQVNCLLAEICKEKSDMQSSGLGSKPFDFGDYNKNYIGKWKGAMGKCKSPEATLFPSGNTNRTCNPTYDDYGNSNCMLGSVKTHEAHHVQTCENIFNTKSDCSWFTKYTRGWVGCLTWDQYYADEIGAYNDELNYLASEINHWRSICKTLHLWCLTPDPGLLEPSKCPSAPGVKDLLFKMTSYFTGR
jgi:hypothetical protein